MELFFIRHGRTKGNEERRYIGCTDETLLPSSVKELKELQVKINKYAQLDGLYTSPMIRCIETCKNLYPDQPYTIIDELREMNFGDFEYKTAKDLEGNTDYQRFIDSNGQNSFPNGEPREVFEKRCIIGFTKIIDEARNKKQEKIGIIVHGGTIMAILDAFSDPHKEYYNWQVDNGCGYHGRIEDKNERMVIGALHRIWD